MIESYSGSSSGVGFAIPVNYAINIANQIIARRDARSPVPAARRSMRGVNAYIARHERPGGRQRRLCGGGDRGRPERNKDSMTVIPTYMWMFACPSETQ
ncbi:MAG: hypothetical protein ACLTSX_06480 [Collinsella sp.]